MKPKGAPDQWQFVLPIRNINLSLREGDHLTVTDTTHLTWRKFNLPIKIIYIQRKKR